MDEAFAAWLLGADLGLDLEGAAAAASSRLAGGGSRDHRDVAVLGFAVARECATAAPETFLDGVRWVSKVTLEIDGTPYGAAADGVAAMGICLGARALGDDAVTVVEPWIESVLSKLPKGYDAWHRTLVAVAAAIVRPSGDVPAVEAPDILVAMSDRLSLQATPQERQAALTNAYQAAPDLEPVRCVTALAAVDAVVRSGAMVSLNVPTRDDVLAVLRAVPRSLNEWTWEETPKTKGGTPRKWHVDNEYHVQNLLWSILAPIFPDLRREEYVSILGSKQPRADLGIPALRTIIEVKFFRSNKKLSHVIGEIGEDASIYFANQDTYDHLIAFVWDEGRRTEEYAEVRGGLELLPRVVGAVIVARPGKMEN